MKVVNDICLSEFNFWSGAVDRAKYLDKDEFDTIDDMLEELYPDGMSDVEINDFFWFEEDTIANWLGYADFETMCEAKDEDDE